MSEARDLGGLIINRQWQLFQLLLALELQLSREFLHSLRFNPSFRQTGPSLIWVWLIY